LHYEDGRLALHVYVSGFSNNAWLVVSKATNRALIIDTPGEPVGLIAAARETDVVGIVITHRHGDHLEGFQEVARELSGVPVGIGAADAEAVEQLGVTPTLDVSDGAGVAVGDLSLRAIHTPGHTPGSTCLYLEGAGRRLFSGDTLFPGGPGRTGSPADLRQIVNSIGTRLLTLPEDTCVHPGHGPDTTVGEAKAEYEVFASRPRPEDLSGDVAWLGS
jgi:glyoxylase-like metal-dependent hydrolase (beta-lactamase superfamily II)